MPPRPLSRSAVLADAYLDDVIGKVVKVFMANKTALTGKLLKYDAEHLLLENPGKKTPTLIVRRSVQSVTVED